MKTIVLFVLGIWTLFVVNTDAMERFDVLTTQEVKQMLDQRASGTLDFLLVNTLDEMISNDSSISDIPMSSVWQTVCVAGSRQIFP